MKKIIIVNIKVLFFSFILIYLILEFLNYIYSGVPLYDKLNLNNIDIVQSKINKKKYKNNTSNIDFQNFKNGKYSLNKCGLSENGKYNLAYKRDKFRFRENKNDYFNYSDIVLIGDSFIYGVCINSPHDPVSQIKKLIPKKILNLSMMGSNPKKQVAIMKNCTKDTSFKIFIWFFYEGNDYEIDKIIKNKKCKQYPHNMMPLKLIKKDFVLNYDLNKITYFTRFKIILAEKLRGLSTFVKYFTNYPNLLNYKAYNKTVSDMSKYLDEKKINRKIIFYIPKYTRLAMKIKNNHPQLKQLDKLRNEVKKVAIKNGFEFADSTFSFQKLENPLLAFNYELPTHFSEKGSKTLAKSVYNYLSQ